MSTRSKALNAYRHGLRATRIAFQNDTEILSAARAKMRSGMASPPNPKLTAEEQIQHLEDVAVFLRRNLVQGKKVEGANMKQPRYHLNIHGDTELGDNEAIADPTAKVKTNLKARPFKCSDKKQ
ncbi:Mzm1p SKDI_04G6940 [Saccharomyces kudriavzevii IFO 1802]|uniref:Mitochondrial zinc maintenance protein 1, mitochondrial n=3 Tax=Saccharomyces TaxID=4930 RepID=J6EJW6_SACK1|nr:uncharacterized protein SKDI_04G6940 [Saccharomyces kudriavzevii IFO 1802]EHN02886.1 YDR493W-like protein [Saccharomyces cerevisiae x Saccharomyces kudriavzevii VIN7]EJT43517.1 MZM1-like protein [Saccharomyces kudriavzevii IFO 1802]CAI4059483.1 hypothetical protein SKDI_04G6940 [Saccharomyces kudriavzevii IFO 1802]